MLEIKEVKEHGTTNVLRTVGRKAAIITLICDALKGVAAILIARLIGVVWNDVGDPILLEYLAGFFAIAGHTFPIFFEFRGGKGVATSIGILLLLNWKIALICLPFAIILIIVTKMVSVASITAAILYPIVTIVMSNDIGVPSMIVSVLIALFVIFNHRGNIKRIRNGTENKIDFKNTKK